MSIFSHSETNDSGSHCNSSWKLSLLIGIYTTPCCRAMFHLDAAAKFIWKAEGPQCYWIPREASVAFRLGVLFPFYQRAALYKFLFFP